jgi:hypothetical protein
MSVRKQATIMGAEKATGLPGSHPVTMPTRQTSIGSVASEEAVPSTDPKDVSFLLLSMQQEL